ncbi:MAG: DNA-processing protein DprA [Puniceicoccales bacterium]|jgi:DNA processing protein|nr:DNA-processing protein DprA [Puniceicoccales bacterium]
MHNDLSSVSTKPSPPQDCREARLILNALPGMGPVTCRRLLDALGPNPVAIFHATQKQLLSVKGVGTITADAIINWHTHFDPVREKEKMAAFGINFVIPEDTDAYPALLREIYDPPIGLYSTGQYTWRDRCVAIVGSRHITPYGREMARALARGLAGTGWCIVSGLARGIDTVAHQGALEAGGPTVAVLGCGPDIVYPPENLELYRKIAANGVIFSEFSFGKKADKQTFPMRNRIVSGMCRAIVVIESDIGGGSMITAKFAAEQNRVVCAVPGRADQASSRGCHALIRDGATLVTSIDEILEELNEPAVAMQSELNLMSPSSQNISNAATPEEANILAYFAGGTSHSIDSLADITGLPASSLMGTLLMMELNRLIIKGTDGRYEAIPRL